MDKYKKCHVKIIYLKYEPQHRMKNLNYLMDNILYQTFKTILNIYIKKKTYYLELLTLETMGLLEISKSKITKNQNGENVPYLEITEVVLMHCYVVNNNYQQNSKK